MNFHAGRDSGCSLLILFYIIVVPALVITFHAEVCNAFDKTDLYCNNKTYQIGSTFESNLNTMFNSLVRDTSLTGFNTSVYGQSPDRVYGLLQCRGDATPDQCYNCSRNAAITVRQSQNCGKAVGGRIWSDLCFLRYENYSFIGKLDDDLGWYHYNRNNVSINPEDFKAALQSLFASLSAQAANVPSSNRYASGATADSFFPKTYALVQCNRDISVENCTECLSHTTANIFAFYNGRQGVQALFSSCIVGYEKYIFFNSSVVVTRSLPPTEAPFNRSVATTSSNSTVSNKIPTILGVVGGSLLLALLAVCVLTTRRRLKRYKVHEQVEEDTLVNEDRQIATFNMETLVAATENFHDDNKLGEGGFGPVYKGTTHDGKQIAVKKLSLNSRQGTKEFLNEVKVVAKIQHRNLVKLVGCCAERSERLLVYEYLRNSSLDKILFDPLKRGLLDWRNRYNIILGVARGLLYLHEDSQPRIVHRDIKASNILLDDKLNPKIADFGLAKLFPNLVRFKRSQSSLSSNNSEVVYDDFISRTLRILIFGYMAPEYAMQGQLTAKADVYSFGVLLMELITGRKNTDYNLSPEMQIILGWAWRSYEGGKCVELIDEGIVETCDKQQVLRCMHVGLLCTQADSSLRPPMSTVNLMISSHAMTLPDPTKPFFTNPVCRVSTGSSRPGSGLLHASIPASFLTPLAPTPTSNAYANSITELVPR